MFTQCSHIHPNTNNAKSETKQDSEMTFFMCGFPGEVINEKDRCKKCEGQKVCKETKLLEVHVDKGMRHGQKITFSGEADQAPGVEPGDIVLVLQEKEHEVLLNTWLLILIVLVFYMMTDKKKIL